MTRAPWTVQTGNSSTVRVGDRVVAVGNGGGRGLTTKSGGRVTGLGQSITISGDDGATFTLPGLIETTTLRSGDSVAPC